MCCFPRVEEKQLNEVSFCHFSDSTQFKGMLERVEKDVLQKEVVHL